MSSRTAISSISCSMSKTWSHAPADYECPFCALLAGKSVNSSRPEDVIYRDNDVAILMASTNWPNNRGHVLVIPVDHYENVFDIDTSLGTPLLAAVQRISVAMKQAYGCDGTTTRQSNEPAGNQHVWHYHIHVYPRYDGDNIFMTTGQETTFEERESYRSRLVDSLESL